MESIRRRIKIFWLDHRDPILFWVIIFGITIIIVQILNENAKQNNVNENKELNTIAVEREEYYKYATEYLDKDIELIESFIKFCKNKNIEEAYSLISENCKNDIYPTINDFKERYYNNRFNKKVMIQVAYKKKESIFTATIYPDILETGKYVDNESIVDNFVIEQEVLDRKIYINKK